ncbi:MAG: pyrroline-5-carboxylate reductase [Actinobacteria bacterium]|nr:pyrroline-5-carboxylate reductase [Actinomycetota bacterium]
MNKSTVAILGCGAMGSAILSGMLHHGTSAEGVKVTALRKESAEQLAKKFKVTAYATEYQPNANSLAVHGASLVLLSVKPNQIVKVIQEISPVLAEGALIVSVAAGVTTATMESRLPKGVAVIRAMPNTPALIGKGVTGISAGASATAEQVSRVEELFNGVGKTLVIPESQIDALSTISGSGPAYVFYFIEEFIAAAMKHGFTQEQAYLMVSETFDGAAALLVKSQGDPAELRRQVTSPNGTTMKAVAVMENANLHELFFEATSAALARAKEIAQEMK